MIVAAAACLAAAACSTGEEEPQAKPSLDVSPLTLAFGASGAVPQTVTVEAVQVAWTYRLSGSAEDWVEVSDNGDGTLTVSVTDNPKAEERSASLTVEPSDGSKVKAKTVAITQEASDVPAVYSFSVEPAALTFEAEGAAAQDVVVTVEGEGLTWSAVVEDAAEEWLTVTEGEGKFTVTVADNPATTERAANITVTPGMEEVAPKVVRVVQKAKILPPSLDISLSNGATPEEGFVFSYLGDEQGCYIDVKAVNVAWMSREEYDSETTDWITLRKDSASTYCWLRVMLNNRKNESPDSRTGRIVIYTGTESIGPYEVKVTQEGKPDYQSTITGNVAVEPLTGIRTTVSPNTDKRQLPYTEWSVSLWNGSVAYDAHFGKYSGSGEIMQFDIATEPIEQNGEGIYRIPAGTYTLAPNFGSKNDDGTPVVPGPWTVSAGERGLWQHPSSASGTWYLRMQDGKYNGEEVRVTEGTLTVTDKGNDTYRFEWDFVSDAGYRLTGSYEGSLDLSVVP